MSTHTINKPLSGAQGYKRLARLVARAFYSGDVPPKDEEGNDEGQPANRSRFSKHSFEGLAIVLIDYLTSNKVDGYVDEATIASELRLSQKNIRKTLRYLEGEHLVAAETVKLSFKRTNIEVDDAEVAEQFKRKETRVFWCMDYPRLRDAMQLRLLKISELLLKHVGGASGIQLYICPQCGSRYTSLDAPTLLDFETGTFRCEVASCRTELVDHIEVDGALAKGGADINTKERQAFFKGLQERFDTQMKPIVEQLDRIKEVDPPDVGSLQDWYQGKKEEAERRAKRLEAAKKRAAQAGEGSAAFAGMTEDQLLEWAERAEVVVALPGAEGSSIAASAAVAGKEVPLWFRGEGTAAAGSNLLSEEAQTAEKVSEEEQRRILEQQYLQQYLAQVRQGGGSALGGGEDKDDEPAAKKAKIEEYKGDVALVKAEPQQQQQQQRQEEGVKVEAAKEEELAWEDIDDGNGAGGEQQANGGENDGDMDWEDA